MNGRLCTLAATAALLAPLAAAACSGTCADINSNVCSRPWLTGLCPGASSIQCCTGALCHGQCASSDEYTCSTGFASGLCNGASNVMCCSGTLTRKSGSSCSGQCSDINSYTCSSGFVSGLCPGASNIQCCTGSLSPRGGGGYNRGAAVSYADQHWNSPNHDCSSSYSSCTPYSYWGGEHCGYSSHGGDCANFVSQCLLAGGHAPLSGGGPCRGYPCGNEEVGAKNLGDCLAGYKGWTRSCGYHMAPPSSITVGDVLIYHKGSCSDSEAHATIVTSMSGGPQISCHSNEHHNIAYTYMASSMPYYEWLHKN
eukprot:m51a1_g6143 hypothetical protein (311) ;mRNA; r:282110-283374